MRHLLHQTFIGPRFFCLILCLFLAGCGRPAAVAEVPWYNGHWAHEYSDLAPDSRVHFGRLDNGMRYAVIPHAKPEGRASLYLDVQAGSLMEEDQELGFAHFVEHMAFNGTRRFPPQSLIPFFQQNGMSFGGDSNAHTTLDETVYKLNLASTDANAVSTGLPSCATLLTAS